MYFTYNWKLSDLQKVKSNNLKVFSCFSSGDGSTMGYKISDYEVIGCCEIDKSIMKFYIENFHPKHPFTLDIRELLLKAKNNELPQELYNLDILDASPPCTIFSMSGLREKSWGVIKKNYITQAFIIDRTTIGLPQKRRRLFFIAQRQYFYKHPIQLNFNEKPIPFYKIRDDNCK